MTRLRFGGLAIALVTMALSAVGCADKEKQDLISRNGQLEAALRDARAQANQADVQNKQLADQMAAKDAENARLAAELAKEKNKGTAKVDGGTSAGGWERGIAGDRITLESDILFASGKADLTAAGKAKLDKVVADIQKSYAGLPVLVIGFTDTDPIKKSHWLDNLDLGSNRANAVTRYLISKGLKAADIDSISRGDTHPAAGDKAKSRRVDIIVVKGGARSAPAKAVVTE